MYHCKIQFYDTILKFGHNGQGEIQIFLTDKRIKQKHDVAAMLSFQLLYKFEGKYLNNYNHLMGQF